MVEEAIREGGGAAADWGGDLAQEKVRNAGRGLPERFGHFGVGGQPSIPNWITGSEATQIMVRSAPDKQVTELSGSGFEGGLLMAVHLSRHTWPTG